MRMKLFLILPTTLLTIVFLAPHVSAQIYAVPSAVCLGSCPSVIPTSSISSSQLPSTTLPQTQTTAAPSSATTPPCQPVTVNSANNTNEAQAKKEKGGKRNHKKGLLQLLFQLIQWLMQLIQQLLGLSLGNPTPVLRSQNPVHPNPTAGIANPAVTLHPCQTTPPPFNTPPTSTPSVPTAGATEAGDGTQTTGGVNWIDPLQYQKPAFVSITLPNEATVGNKYYVDMSTGSGSTCSQTSPCASIDNVMGKAGTTGGPAYIYIRGTGNWSGFNDNFYGSPGNEIVIKPWGTATATFTANSNANSGGIHDVIFDGGPNLGIVFLTNVADQYNFHVDANNITIYRTRSYSTATGELFAVGGFVVASNVKFINNEFYGCNQTAGNQCSAVYVGPGSSGGFTNFVFKNNIIRDMGGEGIEINPRVVSNGMEISGNAIHNVGKQTCSGSWLCRPGITLHSQNGQTNNGIVIKNNLTWDTGSGCVWARTPGNTVVNNNTCYDYGKINPDTNSSPNPEGISGGNASNVTNNIIYASNGTNPLDVTYSGTNNLCGAGKSCGSSSRVWSANTVLSTVENNANFLKLGGSSEALNTGGTISKVTNDYSGTSRPQGSGWDIGAYESGSGNGSNTTSPTTSPCQPVTVNSANNTNEAQAKKERGNKKSEKNGLIRILIQLIQWLLQLTQQLLGLNFGNPTTPPPTNPANPNPSSGIANPAVTLHPCQTTPPPSDTTLPSTPVTPTIDATSENTYYVATTGTNNTSCGSTASPCATAQYALDNKVGTGDTIRIKPGTYAGGLNFNNTTNHDNVTVTADDPGNRPRVGGASIPNGVSGVTVSYLHLDGGGGRTDCWDGVVQIAEYPAVIDHNEIANGCDGVLITTSREITISNNHIHNMGVPGTERDEDGIAIDNFAKDPSPTSWETGIKIIGNSIHDNSGDGTMESSEQDSNPSSNYLTLANNTIYNNEEQGSDFKGTQNVQINGNDYYSNTYGGISTNDSDVSANYRQLNYWIYNNKIHDHNNFGLFSQEGDDGNWYVWNNLFYNNAKNPQYSWFAFSDAPPNSRIENNVFWNNNRTAGAQGGGGVSTNGTGTTIRNNIFYNNGLNTQGNISSGAQGTISYNYVYPASPGITGTNAIIASNPNFVSLTAPYNFHLQSNSPAINVGLALTGNATYTINIDPDNKTRPQGSSWDIGAYESGQ